MRVVHTGMCKYCPTNSGEVLCHGQDVEALSDLDCCMLAQLFQPFSLDFGLIHRKLRSVGRERRA